jgi:hypothetical protein
MGRPTFEVRLKGEPPKHGWALRHLSGAVNAKRDDWVSLWEEPTQGVDGKLEFSPSKILVFDAEQYARSVSKELRDGPWKIDTEVVKA